MECKKGGIGKTIHKDQLKHYFQNIPETTFGVLTNGVKYKFYCDKDQTNVMEDELFLDFDITDMSDDEIDVLRHFHKHVFDHKGTAEIVRKQVCTAKIKRRITDEMANPSEDFTRCITQGVGAPLPMEQLRVSVKQAFAMVIKDLLFQKAAVQIVAPASAADEQEKSEAADETSSPSPPASTQVLFYYYDGDGQKRGPHNSGQIRWLVSQGEITRGTLIENEAGKQALAEKVKGLTFPE